MSGATTIEFNKINIEYKPQGFIYSDSMFFEDANSTISAGLIPKVDKNPLNFPLPTKSRSKIITDMKATGLYGEEELIDLEDSLKQIEYFEN